MKKEFLEALEASPVIAAVKDDEGLNKSAQCESGIVFILYGDVLTIPDIVASVRKRGKIAMVHADLINGLASKEVAVDFLKKYTLASGIITTHPGLIKRARELDLYTVLRLFLIDSMAYENIDKQISAAKPDVIEVMPAPMPRIVSKVCAVSPIPVIAGGLISDKEDVVSLLNAGVISVSTTNPAVWAE